MTQNNPANDPQSPSQPPTGGEPPRGELPAPKPAPKRRWLRRTLYIVAGLVIVLLLLVLLIPTIASMGWVRSIVVGKVNDQLNGKLQIADWSIGWTGGIKADGIKIFDDQNRQILEIPHVSTQLSLLGAIKGKYALGDTVVQGLDFYLLRDGDTINFAKLAKPSTSSSSTSSKTESEKSSGKLPEVSGQIRLVNCRGTIENITKDPKTGKQQHDMVKLTSIDGDAKIPDLNQPITNSLKIVEENGASVPGTITLNGQVIAAKNNELLKPDQMDVTQTLTLENIDLKGFAFAVPDTVLAGNSNGSLNATLKPGEGASLSGSIQLRGFRYGGAALSGDTYSADSLTLAIPQKTGATLKTVGDTLQLQRLSTGGAAEPITITVVNSVNGAPSTSTIKLLADASPTALQNLAGNKAPGAPGTVRADLDLDLVPLAQMLPHVLHTLEGVKLDKGRITNTLEIRLSAAQADISQALNVSAISGEDTTHKKIAIDPINLTVKASDRGGLAGKIPDLHDVTLNLSTGNDPKTAWASANVTAVTLSALKGAIHADIQRAQAQLGQLIDTGALKLGGQIDTTFDSQGDLLADIKPGQTGKTALSINTTMRDLVVDGLTGKPPVKEPYGAMSLKANLERGSDGLVKAVRDVKWEILLGNEAKPSVKASIAGDYSMAPATGAATAPSANEALQYTVYFDPTQIQTEFGAFLTSLSDKHLQFTNGIVGLTGTASYDGKKAILDPTLNCKDITLVKDKTKPVLSNYTFIAKVPATYESGAGGGSTITMPSLYLGDSVNMVHVENVKDQTIRIVTTADGRLQPTAALNIINIDLKQLNDLLTNFSAEAVATSEQGNTLRSGLVSGTANVSATDNHQIQMTSDLAINSITITAPQAAGLQNEQVKVALNLRAADDLSAATVNSADVTSSFLNAHASDTQLMLKQGTGKDAQSVSTMDMLRKATVKLDVPSLAKLQSVMDAFSPPTATVAAAAPAPAQPARSAQRNARPAPQQPTPAAAEAPKPPTKLTGGSATFTLNATRNGDRLSIVPTGAMRAVTARQGDQDLPVNDVDLSATSIDLVLRPAPTTSASVASATTQPSIMDQIKELKIGQLAARVTGAEIVVNGSIVDPGNTRSFQDFAVDLNYDAPKLWPYLVPLIFDKESQAKWQNAKVAGTYKKHFPVTGSYPATLPAGKQPITLLATNGDITLDHFEAQGATIDKLFLPLTLKDGILSITDASKPAGQNLPTPATVNGGKLDLGGAVADMTTEHTRLTLPPNKKLAENIDLNPALAQNVGDWINNPLYITANQAAGKMSITVAKCENLPLDDTVKQPVASNTGIFDANITVSQVQLGNDMLEKVSSAIATFSPQTLHVKSLQGEITQWHVVIDHGVTHTDMVLALGENKRPLHLFGDVAMLSRNMNMTLDMPWELFGLKNNPTFAAIANGGIAIPLSGPVNNPQFDPGKAIQQNLQQNLLQNGGKDLLNGILGQKKDDKNKSGQSPSSQPAKEDPLKALQDLLNQNKDKKKDK